jgi:hypothetical protein
MQGIAHSFLELASRHYPERLETFYVVGAPPLFSILWNAVYPLVDSRTRTKIRFLPCALPQSPACVGCLAVTGVAAHLIVRRHRSTFAPTHARQSSLHWQ